MPNHNTGIEMAASAAIVIVSRSSAPAVVQDRANTKVGYCYGINSCRARWTARPPATNASSKMSARGMASRP